MIEQLVDFVWWALSASPFFLIGGLGGGRSPAQPPQLNPTQSAELLQRQLEVYGNNIPRLTEISGDEERRQQAENVRFGLGMLTNPSGLIYGSKITEHQKLQSDAQTELNALQSAMSGGRGGNISAPDWQGNMRTLTPAQAQARVAELNKTISDHGDFIKSFQGRDAVGELRGAFSDQYRWRDQLIDDIGQTRRSSPEYARAQEAMQRGIPGMTVGWRQGTLNQANAAGMGRVGDVRARDIGSGRLGDTLMSRALERANSQGRLSPEANRDAVQAARSGMAARGMATGNAGMAAELLNRDRYSRSRMAEDLSFAQGVQGQDLERQLANAGNVLRADMANQQTQFGREQIISENQQQANLANMQAANNMSQFNTEQAANMDRFNVLSLDSANRFNVGLLGQSAAMSDQERARQLALGQDAYNFSVSTDPRMMLAGLGSPYASMTAPSMSMISGAQGLNPIYSGGSFSRGNQGMNMLAGGLGGAMSGAAMGSAFGPWGAGIGGALGLGAGLLGSAR